MLLSGTCHCHVLAVLLTSVSPSCGNWFAHVLEDMCVMACRSIAERMQAARFWEGSGNRRSV